VEHEIVANAYHHVNWGTPIAVYFWLVGSSAGSFVISSLGWVFGIKKYKPISFFASNLAICQLLLVPILLVFDLGQAMRFTHLFPVITGFWHATAPLAWGTALVASYPVGMAIYSYLIYRHNEKWAKVFGLIAVFQACGTHWYTGITMALNPARHPNHTAMASILFLVGAFISGIGLLNLILYIRNKFVSGEYKLEPSVIIDLGRLMLYGLLLDAFLVFLEFINMNYGTEEEFHVLEMVSTVFVAPVLGLYIFTGLFVPLLILVSPWGKKLNGVLLASGLIAVGIFGMRVGWVLISQFSQTFF
jgi:molybdopterin-containing oxidoreductase family membrane subunit